MDKLRYAVGMVAGILDGFGLIRIRNAVLSTIERTGKAMNGFDLTADGMMIAGGAIWDTVDDWHTRRAVRRAIAAWAKETER